MNLGTKRRVMEIKRDIAGMILPKRYIILSEVNTVLQQLNQTIDAPIIVADASPKSAASNVTGLSLCR